MFAVTAANSIHLYGTLREAIIFAENWNFMAPDETARVFQPQMHDEPMKLVDIIDEADDDAYRRKLTALADERYANRTTRKLCRA
jgi:hypothetical protein